MGLIISKGKIEIMKQTRRNAWVRQNLTIGKSELENVTDFTYLVADLSRDVNETNKKI